MRWMQRLLRWYFLRRAHAGDPHYRLDDAVWRAPRRLARAGLGPTHE